MLDAVARIVLLGLLALTSGSVWWYVVRQFRQRQQPIPSRVDRRQRVAPAAILAVIVLWIAKIWLEKQAAHPGPELNKLQFLCLLNGLFSAAGLFLFTRFKDKRLWELNGGAGDWKGELRFGALGFAASILPVYAVMLLIQWLWIDRPPQPLLQLLQRQPDLPTFFWVGLLVVVLVPPAEELIYRGLLQGILEEIIGPHRGIAVAAVVFSVVHGWPVCLAIFPLAVILGYVYHQRGSLLAVTVLHALFNALNLFLAGMDVFGLVGSVVCGLAARRFH